MKRSEMVDNITWLMNAYHPINSNDHRNIASLILERIEDLGMLPPEIQGSDQDPEGDWYQTFAYAWELEEDNGES